MKAGGEEVRVELQIPPLCALGHRQLWKMRWWLDAVVRSRDGFFLSKERTLQTGCEFPV